MRKFDFNEELHVEILKARAARDAEALENFEPKVIYYGPGTSFADDDEVIEFMGIGREMFDSFPLNDTAEFHGNKIIRGWEIFHSGGSFFIVTAPKGSYGAKLKCVKMRTQLEWAHSTGHRCGNLDCMECY